MNNPVQLGTVRAIRTFGTRWFVLGLIVVFGGVSCGLSDADEGRAYRSAAKKKKNKGNDSPETEEEEDECPSPRMCPHEAQIDWERSLVIRDANLLEGFTFKRVMDQIVETSGDPDMTSLELYQRWWDTMNAANIQQPFIPSEGGELARFDQPCDQNMSDGLTFFNDFPVECPRIEGILAYTNPFEETITNSEGEEVVNPDSYVPVGLFNRLDLAASDGSHCGEMRIVFAKRSGLAFEENQSLLPPGGDRNLLIFEAVIPNPKPECGVEACLPLAQQWHKLSRVKNQNALRHLLENLYFEGTDEFPPAIHADHLGPNGGHVRTNQFMPAISVDRLTQPGGPPRGFTAWQLRDFKLTKDCNGSGTCELGIKQLPIDDNPFGALFAPEPNPWPQSEGFKSQFLTQIRGLAGPNLKTIFMDLDSKYLASESNAPVACLPAGTPGAPPGSAIPDDSCYDKHFDPESQFAEDIQAKLDEIGSSLTPTQIVQRADTLSCAGCHQNVKDVELGPGPNEFQAPKPPPIDFVHIREEDPTGGRFFELSPMMHQQDIPHRMKVMSEFMCKGEDLHKEEKEAIQEQPGVDEEFVEKRFETLGGPKRVH